LKGLLWPLWLPEAWYNKGCIHRLANPRKGCASIVFSIGHEVGGAIAHRGQSLISTTALIVATVTVTLCCTVSDCVHL